MSDLHAMPTCITNITHSACYTVEMGASAGDLTRITLDNNHKAYKRICLQGIGCVCVKNNAGEARWQSWNESLISGWIPRGFSALYFIV